MIKHMLVCAAMLSSGVASAGDSLLARSAKDPQPFYHLISIVWEGRHVRANNVEALVHFREAFPNVPVIHFINPAYLSAPGSDGKALRTALSRVVRPTDQIGLYLQPFKDFVIAAGVTYRAAPSYWGAPAAADCGVECGSDVPITAYDEEEITKLVRFAVRQLKTLGFNSVQSVFVGGWLASQQVLDVVSAQGFKYDYSAVPPEIVKDRLSRFPLQLWLTHRWHFVTPDLQPHMETTRTGQIAEMGNAFGLADYVEIEQTLAQINAYAARSRADPATPLFVHFGMHQETASDYLPRVVAALKALKSLADNGVKVLPLALAGQRPTPVTAPQQGVSLVLPKQASLAVPQAASVPRTIGLRP